MNRNVEKRPKNIPSQNATAKNESGIVHEGQAGTKMYKKKNGSQHAIKLPMIRPNMRVARFSFFLAILRFSFSGSLGLGFGRAASISQLGVVTTGAGVAFAFVL
jgi:hypothetical protein